MSTPDSSASLFDRLGGAPAIDAAVDKFYEKVLADDRIKHFFEGVNMDIQAAHQKSFLTYAFEAAPMPMRENRCARVTRGSSTIWV